jgi:hypothetical protein
VTRDASQITIRIAMTRIMVAGLINYETTLRVDGFPSREELG